MFPNKRINLILYAAFAIAFVLAFAGMRTQALIGDRQFLLQGLQSRRISIDQAQTRASCPHPGTNTAAHAARRSHDEDDAIFELHAWDPFDVGYANLSHGAYCEQISVRRPDADGEFFAPMARRASGE